MIAPIYIKKFDRRTAIFIEKTIDISIDDIKETLSTFFLRGKITKEADSDIYHEYKISFRLTEGEKAKVLRKLYQLSGIDYEEIKAKNREIVKNRPKKKKIVDENIITGFSGNLFLNDLQFHYKVIN